MTASLDPLRDVSEGDGSTRRGRRVHAIDTLCGNGFDPGSVTLLSRVLQMPPPPLSEDFTLPGDQGTVPWTGIKHLL